jgi:hypothetical protein
VRETSQKGNGNRKAGMTRAVMNAYGKRTAGKKRGLRRVGQVKASKGTARREGEAYEYRGHRHSYVELNHAVAVII